MLIFCPEKSGAGVSRPAGSGGDIGVILAYLSRCCRVYAWGLRTYESCHCSARALAVLRLRFLLIVNQLYQAILASQWGSRALGKIKFSSA
jgi:hypothetical protein